jgi:hypothetical protein
MHSRTVATWILFVGAMLLAVATVVHAEPPPRPGTVVSIRNLDRYESFLSPAMQWVVDRGYTMRVVAPRPIAHPPAVIAATEKYAGDTELAADGSHLLNHVAGLPFPGVDSTDPTLATKLMFNFASAINHDDSDIRNFHCDTGSVGDDGDAMIVERHFLIDHIRRLYFSGRTEVEPLPTLPNRDRVRFKEALYPLIEPFDLKGVGFTMNRYLDHKRQGVCGVCLRPSVPTLCSDRTPTKTATKGTKATSPGWIGSTWARRRSWRACTRRTCL